MLMISDPLYITNEKSKGPSGTLSLFGQNKRAAEHRFGSHFVNMMAEQGQKCEGEKVKLVLYQTEQNVGGKHMMMHII